MATIIIAFINFNLYRLLSLQAALAVKDHTRTTTFLSSCLDVLPADSIQPRPELCMETARPRAVSSDLTRRGRRRLQSRAARRSGEVREDAAQDYASITTGVPSSTISNSSITSSLRILTHP